MTCRRLASLVTDSLTVAVCRQAKKSPAKKKTAAKKKTTKK